MSPTPKFTRLAAVTAIAAVAAAFAMVAFESPSQPGSKEPVKLLPVPTR